MFKGSLVALITPFRNGKVDEKAFQALVEWQVREGTDGLVPCGTTGESPTLSHAEHKRVIELCIEAAAGKVPVMAGAGSNSTAEAVELVKHARKAGAEGALVVTPYYNKPTQRGLYAHYKVLNDEGRLPIFIYNIPGRSVIDMVPETMGALAKLSNIVGVKDATGDISRPPRTAAACGDKFIQLSGNDDSALGFHAAGGHGCISVSANIAPRQCAAFQDAMAKGDYAAARRINLALMPLHTDLFAEANPAPVKWVAEQLGLCRADVRLPLIEVTPDTQHKLKAAMKHAGLKPVKKGK
jgi:4-hydroxy-tetrahydrodipicolinate synthase